MYDSVKMNTTTPAKQRMTNQGVTGKCLLDGIYIYINEYTFMLKYSNEHLRPTALRLFFAIYRGQGSRLPYFSANYSLAVTEWLVYQTRQGVQHLEPSKNC